MRFLGAGTSFSFLAALTVLSLPEESRAVTSTISFSVLPAYFRRIFGGTKTLTERALPGWTVTLTGLSLILTGAFFLSFEAFALPAAGGACRGTAALTCAGSSQLTGNLQGLSAPPGPARSPPTLTLHDGPTLSTKVSSAEAWGSARWRRPAVLERVKAETGRAARVGA